MEFKGRYLIPAPAETVWAGLNNPEVLRQCIAGCERMEKTDPTHFSADATLKVGSVKATFKADIALVDLEPPRRCTLKGEGQGGVAGFARGEAEVLLEPDAGGTVLTYAAHAMIGGKLAQIGQRLIDSAAKQIADDFFLRFAATMGAEKTLVAGSIPDAPPPEPGRAASVRSAATPPNLRPGLAPEVWVIGLIAVIVLLLLLYGVVFDR